MDPRKSAPSDELESAPRFWPALLNAVLIVMATAGLVGYLASDPRDISPPTQSTPAYTAEHAQSNSADAK